MGGIGQNILREWKEQGSPEIKPESIKSLLKRVKKELELKKKQNGKK